MNQFSRLPFLFGLGESEEGIDHACLVADLIEVGLIDEINHQTLFGTIADTGADYPTDIVHQGRLVFDLLVFLEDQLQDVVQVDFLGFQQVNFENNIVPINR